MLNLSFRVEIQTNTSLHFLVSIPPRNTWNNKLKQMVRTRQAGGPRLVLQIKKCCRIPFHPEITAWIFINSGLFLMESSYTFAVVQLRQAFLVWEENPHVLMRGTQFRWHYLSCVLVTWTIPATSRGIPGVIQSPSYFSLPSYTGGRSESERSSTLTPTPKKSAGSLRTVFMMGMQYP